MIFTDGEATLLPYFSGENATNLYTVYFLGRTEREREYWDVYNKNGFWKGKDSEQMHIYTKDIERYINANIKQYYIFTIAIEKRMIKETAENEFLPNSGAVYKTYLLTDGKWIVTDSFNVQETPKETAEYLINILSKRSNGEVKLLRDSLAEGSIASCVRNGKQYVIDGFILNLPSIDEEDFKFEKRNDTLRVLAKRMAEKVSKTGKTVRLNAMPPRERKVIHEVVNKYPDLDTFSEGRDPKRYIVIKKKR